MSARAERAKRGQSWPTYSVLISACGSWLAAVKAAMMVLSDRAPAPSGYDLPRERAPEAMRAAPYSRDEVCQALRRFQAAHGIWPRFHEYRQWRLLTRRLARLKGLDDPRLPSIKIINKKFGSFERAVEVAMGPQTGAAR